MTDKVEIHNDELNSGINDFVNCFNKTVTVYAEDFHRTGVDKQHFGYIIRSMEKFNIIKESSLILGENRTYYELTSFGYEILRDGGWSKYLADKAEYKRLLTEQIKSSIRTNKTTILILVVTIFISGLGAWVSWLNYDFVKRHQEPSRRTIDSLSNKLLEQQTETLRDLNIILKSDSLYKTFK